MTRTIGGMEFLAIPQPYDFEASTERFRSHGTDLANLWRDGGLHRVIAGQDVRVEAAPGGVRITPSDPGIAGTVSWLLGLPLDLDGFWAWAEDDPVLAALAEPLRGYRPPLVADRWEMLVTSITAQQVSLHSAFAVRSRLIERFGVRVGDVWAFPTRERLAEAAESEIREVGFSTRKAEYVIGLAQGDLDLGTLDLLSDGEVVETITAERGLGRWTADWFLARALARPDAWPGAATVRRRRQTGRDAPGPAARATARPAPRGPAQSAGAGRTA